MIDPISKKLFQSSGTQGPIVLMYHSISDAKAWPWSVSYFSFCQQIELLKDNGWKTIRFSELASKDKWEPKTVVITFDDGFSDNYKAFNALKDRGMCATWFIVSRDIGSEIGWSDPGAPKLSLLNKEQIKEMHHAGMEIGSHGHSHSRMTKLDNKSLYDELNSSKQVLSELIGTEVEIIAYPYGIYDERVVDAVKSTGFKGACTTHSGWALAHTDLFHIRRLTIYSHDSLSVFARKLAFASNDGSLMAVAKYLIKVIIRRLFSDEK